ncbi:MAG TPA: Ig-like domain-containing protein [Vicinamibacterales bacterium]|nr:Ig-like domain-containing protein [Vicinamibacterales bacterium]
MKRLLLCVLLFAASASAQPGAARRATNVAALLAHPEFFHMRPVVVVGELTLLDSGELRLATDGVSLRVVNKGSTPNGLAEVRGEFWDLGKFNGDDPRLVGYNLRRDFGIDPEGSWPRVGQATALIASAVAPAVAPPAPSIRNIVLHPSRYLDQTVTVVGQFGGRNLLGDLPDAPAQSRWDFVVRSADAAIWVTNLRPRGKDFELSLDARIDTGRWLEVSGTLQQGRGLQWLNGAAGSVKITQAPKDTPDQVPVRVAAAPPPEVVFSAPTGGETDVLPTASVRIQFSRDMDPASFRGHIRARYAATDGPPLEFTTQYMPGLRVLELKFAAPLSRLSAVSVELQEGIVGADKQPLAPWVLTFETGG